ncbi:HAMP domain-containing histidine kinase [Microbacterium aerolatum]|uniref:sensor histidine kinase n=1 Tax=Microbacterium aerolatum TaxID=153731 RepID=UPI0020013F85|nr:HAMP domain-containing sensor histidine kinase [Microbacterium aerolatum]MCK3769095.1 HAMP domain-containing histidine kinase [Microbacterium aerolatum]
MSNGTISRWRSMRADRTRERTVVLNQLLLGVVALLAAVVAFSMDAIVVVEMLLSGLLLVAVVTGVALAVPWNRIHALWSALLPIMDILAIALLRESNPSAGYSLLWIFPAMWIAGTFGLLGLIVVNVLTNGVYWLTVALDPAQSLAPVVILIPMMIIAVSTTSYLAARRATAQRSLLDAQARLLARAVERARRQEDMVTEVLDAVDFGVIRLGVGGEESVRNDAHARMQRMLSSAGGDRAAFAEDGLTELGIEQTPLARARRGETFDGDLVWYGKPGRGRRALSVTSRALESATGERVGGIVVSRDVTDEVMALRAREDLVASVSHELRTPLTAILGYLELVLDGDDLSAGSRRGLEVAERNAARLLDIIADLLAVSADNHGGVRLSVSPVQARVDEIVHASIEALTPRAAERRITLDDAGIEEVSAFIDPLRIRQVVDNVIGNAVKYNVDAGRVEVGVTADVDHAWIVVRDYGTGISAEELPRLFERFFRADAVRKTTTHGSGLGLSISRDIVRAHGGEITVQSEIGKGSTFVIRLPLFEKGRRN